MQCRAFVQNLPKLAGRHPPCDALDLNESAVGRLIGTEDNGGARHPLDANDADFDLSSPWRGHNRNKTSFRKVDVLDCAQRRFEHRLDRKVN